MKTTSYAQGHVTGFFKIYPNGSTGAGFNISNAIKTTVQAKIARTNSCKILINGKKHKAETSRIVLREMLSKTSEKFQILIRHETKYPIGYGLGLSGAGALSLAEALNGALKLGLAKKEIVEIAAQADIEAGTGLGDVIAEQFNGTMIGLPPYPSRKIAKLRNKYKSVVFGFFGPLSTKKIIRNAGWKKKINKTGSYCMLHLNRERSIENFVHISRVFATETGLASKQVRKAMDAFPNSSMAMLGNTIFVLTNEPKKIQKKLKVFTKRTMMAKIS